MTKAGSQWLLVEGQQAGLLLPGSMGDIPDGHWSWWHCPGNSAPLTKTPSEEMTPALSAPYPTQFMARVRPGLLPIHVT